MYSTRTCVSEIGPYVGIRDTEILFAFACYMFAKEREILSDSEQTFWALRAMIVAAAAHALEHMYALLDAVYFLCAAADPDLPVRAGISELLIFSAMPSEGLFTIFKRIR